MPTSVEVYFERVLKGIEPTRERMRALECARIAIQRQLCGLPLCGGTIGAVIPVGSAARATAVTPIGDLDFILDLQGVELHSSRLSPRVRPTLDDLKALVQRYYSADEASVRVQGHSVGLLYRDHIRIDLVPSVCERGNLPTRHIPDRDNACWMPSDPVAHLQRVQDLDQHCEGQFLPIVRLLKWWATDFKQDDALKAILFESIIADNMPAAAPTLPEALRRIVDSVITRYKTQFANRELPIVTDPSGVDLVGSCDWEIDQFTNFYQRMLELQEVAHQATTPKISATKALAIWTQALGNVAFERASTPEGCEPRSHCYPHMEDKEGVFSDDASFSLSLASEIKPSPTADEEVLLRVGDALQCKLDSPPPGDDNVEICWSIWYHNQDAIKQGRTPAVTDRGDVALHVHLEFLGSHFIKCELLTDGVCTAKAWRSVTVDE
jgi:hypothetical protein